VLNITATVSDNVILLQVTKPLFVPVFISYYFIKNNYINFIFVAFLILSFLGDSASIFVNNKTLLMISSVVYCMSYLCLIAVVCSKLKRIRFDKVVGLYLLLVFLINAYFLYDVYSLVKTHIPNTIEITLYAIKSTSLIALVFLAFAVYLNADTKRSILFLLMSLCLLFSDVIHYVSNYYIYDTRFVMLDRILHVIGLIFLFTYIIEVNRNRKKRIVEERISVESTSRNIMA
jgi:hypothetical protein